MEEELKKRIIFLLYTLFIIVISLHTSAAFASYNATVSWNAPTTNADGTPFMNLAGYKIYYSNILFIFVYYSIILLTSKEDRNLLNFFFEKKLGIKRQFFQNLIEKTGKDNRAINGRHT